MSSNAKGTYLVWVDWCGDHAHYAYDSVQEAIERAKLEAAKPGLKRVRVIGDSYDCDCDADGYYECNDGLSDEERELVEEAGFGR